MGHRKIQNKKEEKKKETSPRIITTDMLSLWPRCNNIAIAILTKQTQCNLFSDTFLQLFKGVFATFLGLRILGKK